MKTAQRLMFTLTYCFLTVPKTAENHNASARSITEEVPRLSMLFVKLEVFSLFVPCFGQLYPNL